MTLKDQINADLAGMFFDTSEFATSAILTHGEESTIITVIFDDGYSGAILSGSEIETTVPQALAISSDVTDAVNGDTLEIDEELYYITNVQQNPPEGGPGTTMLILSEDWHV